MTITDPDSRIAGVPVQAPPRKGSAPLYNPYAAAEETPQTEPPSRDTSAVTAAADQLVQQRPEPSSDPKTRTFALGPMSIRTTPRELPPDLQPRLVEAPDGYQNYFGVDRDYIHVEEIPRRGWRAWVQSATFGLWTPELSPIEREMASCIRAIQAPVGRHRIVASNLKGGATKTTTAVGLGTVLAEIRHESVFGIDTNTRGNAVQRLGIVPNGRHVHDLITDVHCIHTLNDLHRYTNRSPSGLELLASDRDQDRQTQLQPGDFNLVLQVGDTFHRLTVIDTGYDLAIPCMPRVMAAADTLVIATTRARDVANEGMYTLRHWKNARGEEFVRRAVLAVTDHNESGGSSSSVDTIADQFRDHVGSVVVIPYDRALTDGAPFVWSRLRQQTRDAYVRLAAAVAQNFAPTPA